MSTPPFSSTSTQIGEVRYYTEFDPYYYTIDNRPLEDLAGNVGLSGKAADAARIAALITSLGQCASEAGLLGMAKQVSGVQATAGAGTVTVSPGVLYTIEAINTSESRQVLKKAALPFVATVSAPSPLTLGKEVYYLIEIRSVDLTASPTYPYYDSSNTFLASTMLNGVMEVGIQTGAEANIGSGVVPTPRAGWEPMYVVKATAGQATPTVTRHPSAPAVAAFMTEGKNGIGGSMYASNGTDINALTATGWYHITNPVNFSGTEIVVQHWEESPVNRAQQIIFKVGAANPDVYVRTKEAGVWGAPVFLYHSGLVENVAWTAPTFANSWVNEGSGTYYDAGFRKVMGRVQLRGCIKSGTVGSPIFTLPTGLRPSKSVRLSVAANGAYGLITIAPAGTVTLTSGSNTWVDLSNVEFVI